MKGSEKQITWATEILVTVNAILDDFAELANSDPRATPETLASADHRIGTIRSAINGAEYAGDIIALFRDVKRTSNTLQNIQALMSVFKITHPDTKGQKEIIEAYRKTLNNA